MAKDYAKLSKEELIKAIEKLESRKKYGLIWDEERTKEKFETDAENAYPVLKEVRGRTIETDLEKPINLLIEGDNYHSLSVLQYTHLGKIDVIYIDPPYNTGNKDFRYNDQWVDREDTYRHSKWLSFMYKRMKLARDLLSEEGSIFISIDDNEYAQLKLLCDHVFGERNFVAQLVVQLNPRGRTLDKYFAKTHEYIMVYAKNFDSANIHEIEKSEEMQAEYKQEDDNGMFRLLELRNRNPVFNRKNRPNLFYPIFVNPKSGLIKLEKATGFLAVYPRNSKGEDGCWTWGKGKVSANINDLLARKASTGAWRIFRKDRLIKENGMIATTKEKAIWLDKDINNESGKEALRNILHTHLFDFPKSVGLIKKCLSVAGNRDSIVLDYFAGSGTTGHAVLEMNREDSGNRQFILCTNNENNIATNVCYPRIEKVTRGYKKFGTGEKIPGLGGNLRYFKTAFVKKSINRDEIKVRITNECTEMLCVREGIYALSRETAKYRTFTQGKRMMGVYYALDRSGLTHLQKEFDRFKGEKVLYCFTFDPLGLDQNTFTDWQNIRLEPIPQPILDIYQEIHELGT